MPKGTKKKFIDKKNSVTFRLVNRSQKDPLVADERAPQHVLIPINNQNENAKPILSKEELEIKRKEEQRKYGIRFDDDYNYLQHLKDCNKLVTDWEPVENANDVKEEKPKINLPSSVFESNVEEKVGLLNRDVPVTFDPNLDPDIVAAMDDDFDFDDPENELEDDFIQIANKENEDGEDENNEDEEEYDSEFDMSSDEERDQVCNLEDFQLDRVKSAKKSTGGSLFSMSSSVIRRNENLKLLDDIHEKVMSEFDDNEIGSLDCDEIEGYMDPNSELLKQFALEFNEQRKGDNVSISEMMKERLKISDLHYNSEDSDENNDLVEMTVEVRERDKWDCESILTVNSTTRNHPGLIKKNKIDKIIIDPKTGMPKNVLGNSSTKLTAKNLEQFDNENSKLDQDQDCGISIAESRRSQLTMLSYRPDNETPEEKRERKQKLKEYRKERRVEKKANTIAFKQEQKRQEKIQMNNRVNVQGNRIL